MRIAVVGASVLASLVTAVVMAVLAPQVGFAQRAPQAPVGSSGNLIALAASAGDQRQQVTIIDPGTQVMGVYHVDLANGEITLKSVRNIHWDLQLTEFNPKSPLPHEVRSSLERR